MSLAVPGEVPVDPKLANLSAAVRQEIEHAVFTFQSKFAGFGMLGLAKASGWIDEFKDQQIRLAMIARDAK